MILTKCEQGGEEWHRARGGRITASMFRVARSRLKVGPAKGDLTSAAKDYAFRLAVERISGQPLDEGHETWSMRRGHVLEPDARMEHEAQTGLLVERAGFVTSDDGIYGASADGLIGDDGVSEYKCFVAPDNMRAILVDGDLSDCIDQVQGCLWLTERAWCDFCLYCPALRPCGKQLWRRRVERDDAYIETLTRDLAEFRFFVDSYEISLRE